MKYYFIILSFLMLPLFLEAQSDKYLTAYTQNQADSLSLVLNNTSNDTLRMQISRELGTHYIEVKKEIAIEFFTTQIELAEKLNLKLWAADGYGLLTYATTKKGDYIESVNALLKGFKIAENPESEKNIWQISKFSNTNNPHKARLLLLAHLNLQGGHLYKLTEKIEQERSSYLKCLQLAEEINDPTFAHFGAHMLGQTYIKLNKLDSALVLEQKALKYSDQSGYKKYRGQIFEIIGSIYFEKKEYETAKKYFYKGIKTNIEQNNQPFLANIDVLMADLFRDTNNADSSLIYGKKALAIYEDVGELPGKLNAYKTIYATFKMQSKIDSAFHYQELAFKANDSLMDPLRLNQFQNIGFDEQLRIKALEKEKIEKANLVRTYAMLAGIGVVLLVAFLLYRNNRNRKKANELLQVQKAEIEVQKKSAENALTDLKSTQSQLIQSEKMASLGELTAGIAHEIQNPLNFVNNFSEVSKELLEEMLEELKNGDTEEVNAIANDVIQNLEKILHHGKRADGIVKGMLQHSRKNSGKKEATDINALVDEYLRLAYYGLRAKDKSFNANLETNYDDSVGKIDIIPQDIGRVVLNLITNAFYACNEKKKELEKEPSGLNEFKSTVSISTKKENNQLEIKVSDNGNGIPKDIIDKIFQPFFTTKPTGQGTGLGLSMSYDIVTKSHDGKLKVETKEGEGTTFIIQLATL